MRRHENDSTPVVEHEPQRLAWSRTPTRLISTPSSWAKRRLAASRSRFASRRRKSPMRRSTCGASPATQSSSSPLSAVSRQTVPRIPPRWTMRCGRPRNGTTTPAAKGAARGSRSSRGNPRAVLLRKVARLLERPARRNRQHHLAGRRLDTQCVAPRLAVPAHAHKVDRLVEDDLDRLRLSGTAIKQRAQLHGLGPESNQDAIVPHLPGGNRAGSPQSRSAYAGCSALPLAARRLARLARVVRLACAMERTKSAMRGAISARKREPLNTP